MTKIKCLVCEKETRPDKALILRRTGSSSVPYCSEECMHKAHPDRDDAASMRFAMEITEAGQTMSVDYYRKHGTHPEMLGLMTVSAWKAVVIAMRPHHVPLCPTIGGSISFNGIKFSIVPGEDAFYHIRIHH